MNFVITNREIIRKKNGQEYIREDGREHASDNLRFGTYNEKTKNFTLFPEPEMESETVYGDAADKNVKELKGSARFFKILYDELIKEGKSNKQDVLVFIHGFNTDLDGVRGAYDRLMKNYVNNQASPVKHIVIITWPGRSPKIPYHYFDDKKDAIRSGEAFARGIEKLIRFFKEFLVKAGNEPCDRKIHLMVHSMGNRVLKHMMLELKSNKIPVPEIFKEVIIIAADIEYDIFEPNEEFTLLIDFGKRVHIYFHENDRVLDISKFTKNFSNRLGRYGRKRIDPLQIDVIDANVTNTQDDLPSDAEERNLNHWYYYTSSAVVNDIIKVFNGEKSGFQVSQ